MMENRRMFKMLIEIEAFKRPVILEALFLIQRIPIRFHALAHEDNDNDQEFMM